MLIKGKNLIEDVSMIRGFIITDTIQLERTIDDILARYFCDTRKRQNDLKEMFLSTEKMSFEMKRQVLKVILERVMPDFEKSFETLNKYLIAVMEQRNIFAHYELDVSKVAMKKYPKEIGLVKYKNETRTIWYTNKLIQEHIIKITYCIDALSTI